MTFDPVYGAYFGNAFILANGTAASELVLHLAPSGSGGASNSYLGGMASVLQGQGAGQYRRVTEVIDSHTVRLESAFSTPLGPDSLVQIGPFKGRFVFMVSKDFIL